MSLLFIAGYGCRVEKNKRCVFANAFFSTACSSALRLSLKLVDICFFFYIDHREPSLHTYRSWSPRLKRTNRHYRVHGNYPRRNSHFGQRYTVPNTGSYVIDAVGASGSNGSCNELSCSGWSLEGLGARVAGTFDLVKGETLKILIG